MKYSTIKYSHPIIFDKTKVVSDVTNGSWILTRANFHPDMLTLGGARAARSDGGDLRFFTDSTLDNEIPADIIRFTQNTNPESAEVEIVVKCNLSSSVNTVIYVGWGDQFMTIPDRTSPYGRNNAYDSAFKLWCPMYDNTTSTVTDRTSNNNNGTKLGANKPQETTGGQVNRYQSFNGVDAGITFPAIAHGSEHTVFFNFKTSNTGIWIWQNNQVTGGYRLELPTAATDRYWIIAGVLDGSVCFSTAYNNNTWRAFAWKIASTAHYGFVNGVRYNPLGSITAPSNGTGDIRVGWRNLGGGNEYSSVDLDFMAVYVGTLSDDTIRTMQNNHSSTSTFATYGSITEYITDTYIDNPVLGGIGRGMRIGF